MYWLDTLYLGESVRGREQEIRRKLYTHAGQLRVQLLAIAQNETEQIDIIPAYVLMQSSFPREELHIFALAGSKSEAFSLVEQIAKETYEKTGDADMRTYLLKDRRYKKSRR